MKKCVFVICILCLLSNCLLCNPGNCQEQFNLNFEKIKNGMPYAWNNNKYYANGYLFSLDSLTVVDGKYSVSLEYNTGEVGFSTWSFIIPNSYKGKRITLSGYIKTENVQYGYAGLWMRIDPNVALDNMSTHGAKGTTDWKKYSITLDLKPEATEKIVIGGILTGKGKAWFDNFSLKIDGEDISTLDPIASFPAVTDREFEKGSRIPNIILNSSNIENIKQLGLIWGFVKYHHPSVAMGKHNFDFELFRILPKILEADSKKAKCDIVIKWINSLGEIGEVDKNYTISDNVYIIPDLKWINNRNFSPELVELLYKIKNAKKNDQSYYISKKNQGNPSFDHEEKYESMKYPDAGYRLLALFRYWNIIQYFFPYKPLIEEDWKGVLKEFIPKFVKAKDETEYTLTVLEMIARIHDTHAQLYTPSSALTNFRGTRQALPKITFIDGVPVVTGFMNNSLSSQTNLELGDIILSINNKPIKDIILEKLPYSSASNHTTQLRNIATELMKSNEKYIDVEYLRNGISAKTRLVTYSSNSVKELFLSANNKPDSCFIKLTPTISYLYTGMYRNSFIGNLWRDINSSKGLIIDLRCYPAEFMTYSFGTLLVSKTTPFCKVATADVKHPGLFTFTSTGTIGMFNPYCYKGKVIILVNEETQSQAEFTAMAFRSVPNSVVIGSTTAGADGDTSAFYLPGGLLTMISGIGVFYPDGKGTQRIGIVPDIEIHPTIKGIKAGRDELLEKAIEIINAN